jgi:hypothetical protein
MELSDIKSKKPLPVSSDPDFLILQGMASIYLMKLP